MVDPEAVASAGIYVPIKEGGVWARSQEADELVTLDYDVEGNLIGIEIIGSAAIACARAVAEVGTTRPVDADWRLPTDEVMEFGPPTLGVPYPLTCGSINPLGTRENGVQCQKHAGHQTPRHGAVDGQGNKVFWGDGEIAS